MRGPTNLGDAQDVVGIPDFEHLGLGHDNEVGHGGHEEPAGEGEEHPLDAPLLALLGQAQRLDDVGMLDLVVGDDAGGRLVVAAGGPQQGVGQGDGDEAGEGEDEEGEELGLGGSR